MSVDQSRLSDRSRIVGQSHLYSNRSQCIPSRIMQNESRLGNNHQYQKVSSSGISQPKSESNVGASGLSMRNHVNLISYEHSCLCSVAMEIVWTDDIHNRMSITQIQDNLTLA